MYGTPEELHCAVLYNVLALLQHVEPVFVPGGKPAVSQMSQCFVMVPPQFDKECFVFVEMLKLGLINGAEYHHPKDPTANPPYPTHDKALEVALLSRVFSLLPIQASGEAWGAAFDQDLMCFNSIVTKMTRSMRSLFEMQLLHFIIKRRTTVDCKSFPQIASLLPYKEDVGVGMGIVTKAFLEQAHVEKATNVMETLPGMFPACANVVEDLQTAVKFWDVIMAIVSHIRRVMPEFPQALWEEFEALTTP